jgi:hypothetical protein
MKAKGRRQTVRINVYNEEVTDRVEYATKLANNVEFCGIRFFVGRPFEHTPGDDDSPAVTFWYSGPHERALLQKAFKQALSILDAN